MISLWFHASDREGEDGIIRAVEDIDSLDSELDGEVSDDEE